MQNKLFNTLLGAGIAAIIGGAITLTPAISQTVAATLVRNVDEPARNPYQEKKNGSYPITFSAVPAGKRLVITHASGSVSESVSEADVLLIEGVAPFSNQIGVLAPQQYLASIAQQSGKIYVANGDVKLYFEAGQHPKAGFLNNYNASVCLSGYYIDLP